MKINIGCGDDWKEGYINIDGIYHENNQITTIIDKNIDFFSLLRIKEPIVAEILAKDFIEHHFHWEAVILMEKFYEILKPGGMLIMRLPDIFEICKRVVANGQKFNPAYHLFGGQDIPCGKADNLRKKYPEFFCHKYGYTPDSMKMELTKIGFCDIKTYNEETNFYVTANKGE